MRFKAILAILAAAGVALLFWAAGVVWDYFDPTSVAHESMQFDLKRFGNAMYEFHSLTGRWPASLDDLAATPTGHQTPYWKQRAAPIVFLWPQDLKPDPKDNAGVLLAYHKGGLFNELGRVWVCWGDLRTEHLPEHDLRTRLRAVHSNPPARATARAPSH